MANHKELLDLHEQLLNRKCYTMADAIEGGLDGKEGQDSQSLIKEAMRSPLFEKAMLHAKSTDITAGINELSGVILDAAAPNAIGRELVRIIETQKTSTKVRLPAKGSAQKGSRGNKTKSLGTREAFITLTPDKEFEVSEEWDRNYLEDAEWDVASQEAADLAVSLKELESQEIIDTLEATAAGNLATGAVISADTAGTFTYNDMVDLWAAVRSEDFTPNKCAMHTDQLSDLFKDSDFKDNLILGELLDIGTGKFGRTILGCDVLSSSQVTQQHVMMLDNSRTLLYCLRRDTLAAPYEKPPHTTGLQLSTRYDIAAGQSKAMSQMEDA